MPRGRQEGGELDDLRVEVLRQRAYIDRELKAHTEMSEERHAALAKALEERDLEVVALRATIQALGRKVEDMATGMQHLLGQRSPTKPRPPPGHSVSPTFAQSTRSLDGPLSRSVPDAARRPASNSSPGPRAARPPHTPSSRAPSPGIRGQSPAPRPASPGGRLLPTSRRGTPSPSRRRDSASDRQLFGGADADAESRRAITGHRGHPPFMRGPVFAPAGCEDLVFATPSLPAAELALSHIFGFHGRDTKGALCYNSQGDRLAYFSAAVGIVHDKSRGEQRFYTGHSAEITCMAPHPTHELVATAQAGREGCIQVWDTATLTCRATLRDPNHRGLCAVAFSASGQFVIGIASDPFHTLLLYRWQTQDLVADCRVHTEEVLCAAGNPHNERQFVACGRNWVKFFDVDFEPAKPQVASRNGIIGKRGKAQRMYCVHFLDRDHSVTGTDGGELYFWAGNLLVHVVAKVHKGPVFSICSTGLAHITGPEETSASDESALSPLTTGMISAGRDGKVLLWTVADLQRQRRSPVPCPSIVLDILDAVPIPAPIRVVTATPAAPRSDSGMDVPDTVAVGLANNAVWEVRVDGSKAHAIVQGAGSADVVALATHPSSPLFASVTDDKMLRVWNATTFALVHSLLLPGKSRCLVYSPDGALLAVGLAGHNLAVYHTTDMQLVYTTATTSSLSDSQPSAVSSSPGSGDFVALAFSPDQTLLAASSDRGLEVLDVNSGFRCVGRSKGLMATVTHLDWSEDGKVLQTDDTHHQHLFFDWDATMVARPLSVRSVKWATWSCRLGWPVQGVWPAAAEPSDVLAVSRASAEDLCGVGAADGAVRLFAWPVAQAQAPSKAYKGHGVPVAHVRFAPNDEFLLSAGGTNIFVWRLQRT